MTEPPGNSLELDQHARVADYGNDLLSGLSALLERINQEITFSSAKAGGGAYQMGVHDGLSFVRDAMDSLLAVHGRRESPGLPSRRSEC